MDEGFYYLAVDGVGRGTVDSSYSDYGSLGGYALAVRTRNAIGAGIPASASASVEKLPVEPPVVDPPVVQTPVLTIPDSPRIRRASRAVVGVNPRPR